MSRGNNRKMFDNNISARFIEVRKDVGYTDQKEFAEKIGVKWRTLQTYEQGTVKKTPYGFIELLNKHFNVSKEWILTGQGEKYESAQKLEPSDIQYDENKMVSAPIMSIKASAGMRLSPPESC